MDAMQAILTRRSIRSYTDKPVPEEVVKQLLEAAMSAPSAANQQPWHFIIITERSILDEIPRFHPYASMLAGAKVAILVCGDSKAGGFKEYWVQDCSAATENMLIAAHALGLGAVWLGIHPRDERAKALQKLLKMPDHVIPLSLVSIGYPAEKKPPANRFDSSKIHHNGW